MKKFICPLMFVAVLLAAGGCASQKNILIVHDNMPDWASNVVVHKHFWVSYDFRYAFGAASASPSKQWSKVDKRAKNALLTGLKIGTKINNIEIYHRWTDPNTGERYALARMPINLSPREQ